MELIDKAALVAEIGRIQALHPACIPQEFLRASTESEYEGSRQLRIRPYPLQRQAAEIQQ